MKTIKTAISIDTKTFRSVERLTRKLHISRSRFFTQAARYMVKKDENLELLRKINAAFESDTGDHTRNQHEKSYTAEKIVEKW
jgi:metal-responsive CopG/Arc/MetJ family transcriptional regulator